MEEFSKKEKKKKRRGHESLASFLNPGSPSKTGIVAAFSDFLSSFSEPTRRTSITKKVKGKSSHRHEQRQCTSGEEPDEEASSSSSTLLTSPSPSPLKSSTPARTHTPSDPLISVTAALDSSDHTPKVNKVFRTACHKISDYELLRILKDSEDGKYEDFIMDGPAIKPKGGEMYLYRCCQDKDFSYRRDEYTGLRSGGTNDRSENTLLHRWYYKLYDVNKKVITGFQRDEVCLRKSLAKPNKVVAIMYLGDHKIWQPRSHGNSKSGKIFTANTKQAREAIQKKLVDTGKKVKPAYDDLVKETSTRPDFPDREAVSGPRDPKQVENEKYKVDSQRRLFRDEFFSAFEMARCQRIGNFLKFYLAPHESFILAEPEMIKLATALLDEAEKDPSVPQVLVYDTTFCLSDSYVSTVVMKNTFLEGDPIVPICFLLHENKRFENHDVFWRELSELLPINPLPGSVPICCDREAGIVKAIKNRLGADVHLVYCNNHIKRDAKDWVQRCKGKTTADTTVLPAEIDTLLKSESSQEFDSAYEILEATWSQEFKNYVSKHLKDDMRNHAAYFYTSTFPAFKNYDATNNAVESFNAVLKRLTDWETLRVDSLILYLCNLQLNYLKEFSKSYLDTGIGSHVLKAKYKFRKCPFSIPPYTHWKEEQFLEAFREGIYKPGKNVEKETHYLQSRSALAKLACQLQYVSLNSQTLCYTVTDPYNGRRDQVDEDNGKLNCTCESTGVCFHKLAYLHVTQKELLEDRCSWSLSVLKKRTRGFKGRSGKKRPTVDDFGDVEPAPDSDVVRQRSTIDSEGTDDEEEVYASQKSNPRATTRAFPVTSIKTAVHPAPSSSAASHLAALNEIADDDVEEQAGLHNYSNLAFAHSESTLDSADSISTSTDGTTPKEFEFSEAILPMPASIYRKPGFKCLLPGQELMGDVVDDMIALLIRCHGLDDRVGFLNSYIFRTAISALTTEASKVNLLAYAVRTEVVNSDIALVNVHIQNPPHYCLAVINYPMKEIVIVNSAPQCPEDTRDIKRALLLIISSSFVVAGAKFDLTFEWTFVLETLAALQAGGVDCGLYTIMNAYCIVRKKAFFTSENFPSTNIIRTWITRCLTNEKVSRPVALRTFKKCRRMPLSEREKFLDVLKSTESVLSNVEHDGTTLGSRSKDICRLLRLKDTPGEKCSHSLCSEAKAAEARRHVMCVECRLWYHAETCVIAPVAASFYICDICSSSTSS